MKLPARYLALIITTVLSFIQVDLVFRSFPSSFMNIFQEIHRNTRTETCWRKTALNKFSSIGRLVTELKIILTTEKLSANKLKALALKHPRAFFLVFMKFSSITTCFCPS